MRTRLRGAPLSVRLVTSLVVIMAVALLLTGLAATSVLKTYLVGKLDAQLTSYAGAASDRDPYDDRRRGPDNLNAFYVAYLDTAGDAVGQPISPGDSPPDLPAHVMARAAGRAFTVESVDGKSTWRVVVIAARDGSGYRAVAVNADGVESTLARLVMIELGVGVVVLVLVAVGTWISVRRNLRPLAAVEATASAIAGGDLSLRVPEPRSQDEVGRLSLALNVMLGQIEEAFTSQRQSEAAARVSEQRMRQFAADASHELRTPLTSIRGFAELYRSGAVREGPELRRMLRRVEDEATRMGLLVDELLLLARLDQQRPLEIAPVDLAELARDAVEDARAAGPAHPVELQVMGPAVVYGDDARLRQVLANLLANARTHTPTGTRTTVTVGHADGQAYVEVADDGPGMTPAQADHVFERFFRADAARTRATGGSGLGLSIVQALVTAHGGNVTLQTGPGAGATFRVRLPLASGRNLATT